MESRVGPDMTEVRVLMQFGTFRVQKLFLMKFLDDSASFLLEKLKNQVLDPKRATLDQNSDFGHVWTYS